MSSDSCRCVELLQKLIDEGSTALSDEDQKFIAKHVPNCLDGRAYYERRANTSRQDQPISVGLLLIPAFP